MTTQCVCPAAEAVADILADYVNQLKKPSLWKNVMHQLSLASLKVAFHRGMKEASDLGKAFDARFLFQALRDETLPEGLKTEIRKALRTVPTVEEDLSFDRHGIAQAHFDMYRIKYGERMKLIEQTGAMDALLSGKVDWRVLAKAAA